MNDEGLQTLIDVHTLGAAVERLLAHPYPGHLEPYVYDIEAARVALGKLLDKLRQEAT